MDRLPHGNLGRPLTDREKLERIQWWLDNVDLHTDPASEWPMGFDEARGHIEYLMEPDYFLPTDVSGHLIDDPFEHERAPALPRQPLPDGTPCISKDLTDLAVAYLNRHDAEE